MFGGGLAGDSRLAGWAQARSSQGPGRGDAALVRPRPQEWGTWGQRDSLLKTLPDLGAWRRQRVKVSLRLPGLRHCLK